MEKVKIVSVSDGWAFQSHHAFISNMFMCLIKHEGIDYKSAEHFYSAELACYHNRLDLIDDILEARDGYTAKRIVRSIKIKDDYLFYKNDQTWTYNNSNTIKKLIDSILHSSNTSCSDWHI